MERNSSLSLRQMLDRLAEILVHKQTGTFYIATDMNSSCRFAIESGKLTHCTHKRDHGPDAILSLLETGGGSCSFSENQRIPFRPDAAIDHPLSLQALDIHLVIPPKPALIPKPVPAPEKPMARPGSSNYFYRGSSPAPEASAQTEPEAPQQGTTPSAQPRINNRFYRGG
ncbi:MAG: hypothetical protein KJ914_17890 [Gammaproteobacteria bacterium]|nr:hypothetical protein [Gammaproteobacteria bacterium]MBU1724253.1 hypothetical protein [Gammaproteobacteria bacterium]MBU2006319.1 hypothetical protein [Gammaproteobacteria bacterium]